MSTLLKFMLPSYTIRINERNKLYNANPEGFKDILAFFNHFETIYVAIWKFSINNAKNERLIELNFTHEEI